MTKRLRLVAEARRLAIGLDHSDVALFGGGGFFLKKNLKCSVSCLGDDPKSPTAA